MSKSHQKNPIRLTFDYDSDEQQVLRFLSDVGGEGFYFRQLSDIANGDSRILKIRLDDMDGFEQDSTLLTKIQKNAWRYLGIFENVADKLLQEVFSDDQMKPLDDEDDVAEVLRRQRFEEQKKLRLQAGPDQSAIDSSDSFPAELIRKFEVIFVPLSKDKVQSLREVKASQIGRFVTIRGIVTRVGDVLPRIVVACYLCETCGFELYQPVNNREFIPLSTCISPKCLIDKNKTNNLYLRPKFSRFVKYQEIRIQELPDQVPIGNVPRSLIVEARGESTRKCTAGDIVEVTGIFLPEKPRSNFRARNANASLVSSTYLRCMDVKREKKGSGEGTYFDEAEFQAIIEKTENDGKSMYERLAKSIAPEIWGHHDVKKAILLQLVGGVDNKTPDGMKIRGDINIALFGDPGVAKSQLLKHVSTLAPRAVYTTGKGSTGVGLTAAVTRDSLTGEVALEGGALVLADKGICCIDEFDKMGDDDRTAIHEVMEQQTVSIAKAGITTTLNARTAVLAAANPLYGRYNKKISPTENINLPAALLSRFDLLFLLLDNVNAERDRALAEHVTHVHMHNKHPNFEVEVLPPKFIRAFVHRCRAFKPVVPNIDSQDPNEKERAKRFLTHIVEAYVEMRQQDATDSNHDHSKSALTPRQLLSVLRLASAHARLRGAKELEEEDVDEAIRLVRASKASLEDENSGEFDKDDPISRIFRIISEMLKARTDENDANPSIRYNEVEERVLRMGFKREQLKKTLEEYCRDDVGVLHMNKAGTTIRFVVVE